MFYRRTSANFYSWRHGRRIKCSSKNSVNARSWTDECKAVNSRSGKVSGGRWECSYLSSHLFLQLVIYRREQRRCFTRDPSKTIETGIDEPSSYCCYAQTTHISCKASWVRARRAIRAIGLVNVRALAEMHRVHLLHGRWCIFNFSQRRASGKAGKKKREREKRITIGAVIKHSDVK